MSQSGGIIGAVRQVIIGLTKSIFVISKGNDTNPADDVFNELGTGNPSDNDLKIGSNQAGTGARNVWVQKLIIKDKNRSVAFQMKGTRTAPADNNEIAKASIQGNNDLIVNTAYGLWKVFARKVASGAEFGQWEYSVEENGANLKVFFHGGVDNHFSGLVKDIAADPAVADLAAGFFSVFKNTTSGSVFIAVNDGGVIKKVALV